MRTLNCIELCTWETSESSNQGKDDDDLRSFEIRSNQGFGSRAKAFVVRCANEAERLDWVAAIRKRWKLQESIQSKSLRRCGRTIRRNAGVRSGSASFDVDIIVGRAESACAATALRRVDSRHVATNHSAYVTVLRQFTQERDEREAHAYVS